MNDLEHNVSGTGDATGELGELADLLSAHRGFRVVRVKASAERPRKSRLGSLIKRMRFRKFGAEFDRDLTLLGFHVNKETPCIWTVELQWHACQVIEGLSVFIHFVNTNGDIRFQADYPLEDEVPDVLGFFYSRRRVDVPTDAEPGSYRVRLGVWRPSEKRHLELRRFHGCHQETSGWARNAVLLDAQVVE